MTSVSNTKIYSKGNQSYFPLRNHCKSNSMSSIPRPTDRVITAYGNDRKEIKPREFEFNYSTPVYDDQFQDMSESESETSLNDSSNTVIQALPRINEIDDFELGEDDEVPDEFSEIQQDPLSDSQNHEVVSTELTTEDVSPSKDYDMENFEKSLQDILNAIKPVQVKKRLFKLKDIILLCTIFILYAFMYVMFIKFEFLVLQNQEKEQLINKNALMVHNLNALSVPLFDFWTTFMIYLKGTLSYFMEWFY